MGRIHKPRIQFNCVVIALFILTSLSFIRLVSSENSSNNINGDATTTRSRQNLQITVVKPSNRRITATPGSSIEMVWQYSRKELEYRYDGLRDDDAKSTIKKVSSHIKSNFLSILPYIHR